MRGAPQDGPAWRPWQGFAAFVCAIFMTLALAGMLAALLGIDSGHDETLAFRVLATLVQAVVFAVSAVAFASLSGSVRARDFGFRGGPVGRVAAAVALAAVAYYTAVIAYSLLVKPDIEQTVARDLGADDGVGGLVAAAILIVAVAPVAEELFFRGFFYRALRGRLAVLLAAAVDGVVFGFLHWDFQSADQLLIVPPLALFGFLLCLLYERTGTLFAPIALHAFNNTLALSGQAAHDAVTLAVGAAMLALCAASVRTLPMLQRSPSG